MLIVIEGIDGCGKTTVSKALAAKVDARWTEFPDRSTPTGRAIDACLRRQAVPLSYNRLDKANAALLKDADAVTLQSLFAANKYEKLGELAQALCSRTLVCSRYVASGLVYGEADGLDPAWLRAIHAGLPEPDLSILLDIDPAIALGRKRQALSPELYERTEILKRVRQIYLALWESRRRAGNGRYVVVDASAPFDEVLTSCLHWYEARRRNGMRG